MLGTWARLTRVLDVEALSGSCWPREVSSLFGPGTGAVVPDSRWATCSLRGAAAPRSRAGDPFGAPCCRPWQGPSDCETAEVLTFDLRWKVACAYALTDTAFHPMTLTTGRGVWPPP